MDLRKGLMDYSVIRRLFRVGSTHLSHGFLFLVLSDLFLGNTSLVYVPIHLYSNVRHFYVVESYT